MKVKNTLKWMKQTQRKLDQNGHAMNEDVQGSKEEELFGFNSQSVRIKNLQ